VLAKIEPIGPLPAARPRPCSKPAKSRDPCVAGLIEPGQPAFDHALERACETAFSYGACGCRRCSHCWSVRALARNAAFLDEHTSSAADDYGQLVRAALQQSMSSANATVDF